jgi:hypothetical protein
VCKPHNLKKVGEIAFKKAIKQKMAVLCASGNMRADHLGLIGTPQIFYPVGFNTAEFFPPETYKDIADGADMQGPGHVTFCGFDKFTRVGKIRLKCP